jgi:hypothetical protein
MLKKVEGTDLVNILFQKDVLCEELLDYLRYVLYDSYWAKLHQNKLAYEVMVFTFYEEIVDYFLAKEESKSTLQED